MRTFARLSRGLDFLARIKSSKMSLKTRRGPWLAVSKAKQAAAGPKDDCEEGADEPAYRRLCHRYDRYF
jgi:hypothetical protein